MAREVRKFSVTVPHGTLQAAPATFACAFPPRIIREIQILVPPGPRGTVGFQIAQAGHQVFPTEPGQFFVTDDERIVWPIEGANTSGAWQVIAYNTGTFDHTLEVRFLVDLTTGAAEEAAPAFVESATLSE
jgi:hypothetical protein